MQDRPSKAVDARRMRAVLTLAATLAFVLSPFWSRGFNGFEAGQFPVPQNDPPGQPAGYAFSIWGLIYLWLLASAAYGLVRHADDAAWDAPRIPLIVSLTVGAAWLPVAQISPLWATAMIWTMLIAALLALRSTRADRWWLAGPVALYAGWLTAASSVSVALIGAGYGLMAGAAAWAFIALAIALGVAILVLRRLAPPPEYALAVIWALVGIVVANVSGGTLAVAIAAALGAALLVLLTLRGGPSRGT